MFRVLVLIVGVVSISAPFANALTADGTVPAFECVKQKYVGNATTYDPTVAGGWKTGGSGLATGGQYNPDGWEAAIQLDLGRQIGCGVGSGKTCRAVVTVPQTGLAAIVLINDNGPMCADAATYARARDCQARGKFARIIDLNRRSMYFLSNGASGSNSGLLENVEVAVLDPKCSTIGELGPLRGTDKEAWSKIAANMPTTPLPYSNLSTPYGPATPFSNTPLGASPFSLFQSPQQGVSVTSGQSAYPSQGATPSQGAAPSTGGGGAQSPTGTTESGGGITSGTTSYTGPAVATILTQAERASRGKTIVVSWSSVGVRADQQCRLLIELPGASPEVVTEKNAGSQSVRISLNSQLGEATFRLQCTSLSGSTVEKTVDFTIE